MALQCVRVVLDASTPDFSARNLDREHVCPFVRIPEKQWTRPIPLAIGIEQQSNQFVLLLVGVIKDRY